MQIYYAHVRRRDKKKSSKALSYFFYYYYYYNFLTTRFIQRLCVASRRAYLPNFTLRPIFFFKLRFLRACFSSLLTLTESRARTLVLLRAAKIRETPKKERLKRADLLSPRLSVGKLGLKFDLVTLAPPPPPPPPQSRVSTFARDGGEGVREEVAQAHTVRNLGRP